MPNGGVYRRRGSGLDDSWGRRIWCVGQAGTGTSWGGLRTSTTKCGIFTLLSFTAMSAHPLIPSIKKLNPRRPLAGPQNPVCSPCFLPATHIDLFPTPCSGCVRQITPCLSFPSCKRERKLRKRQQKAVLSL